MNSESFAEADQYRAFEDLVWVGNVAECKSESGIHWGKVLRERASGTATTDWLAMREHRAGSNVKTNAPFVVGEQVLVCCPSGELDNGIIVCAVPQEKHSAADSTSDALTLFDTGSAFLRVDLTSGEVTLKASKLNIIAPVEQTGGDMTSDGISAQHHTHDKVKSGSNVSGEPQ